MTKLTDAQAKAVCGAVLYGKGIIASGVDRRVKLGLLGREAARFAATTSDPRNRFRVTPAGYEAARSWLTRKDPERLGELEDCWQALPVLVLP